MDLFSLLSKPHKLGQPENNTKYTQVYAREWVGSGLDNGGDWSSHSWQMLCLIVILQKFEQ